MNLIPPIYKITSMKPEHLPGLMKLKELASWNQTKDDWNIFINNFPNHAFVMLCNEDVVGSATAVNYQNKAAWIAMVLVHPEHRKRGIASGLMKKVIDSLQDCYSIKLDATPQGREVYLRMGFEDEEKIIRFTNEKLASADIDENDNIKSFSANQSKAIFEFDYNVFKCDRTCLLKKLYQRQTEFSFVVQHSGITNGICLGRQGSKYYQIGPLSASSTQDAKNLLKKTLKCLHETPVMLDVPLRHLVELEDFLLELGFTRQREFIRMYLNNNVQIDWDKYFVCAGPEFG